MRHRMTVALLLAVTLAGCTSSQWGSAGTAGAVYTYKHVQGDSSCEVSITSAREVLGGNINVSENCTVESNADAMEGSDEIIRVFGALVDRIPGGTK